MTSCAPVNVIKLGRRLPNSSVWQAYWAWKDWLATIQRWRWVVDDNAPSPSLDVAVTKELRTTTQHAALFVSRLLVSRSPYRSGWGLSACRWRQMQLKLKYLWYLYRGSSSSSSSDDGSGADFNGTRQRGLACLTHNIRIAADAAPDEARRPLRVKSHLHTRLLSQQSHWTVKG